MGHEGVGHIEEIGPEAEGKGFKVGDAIGFLYVIGCCYECEACQLHNLSCETGKQQLQGFIVDGFFAEYAVVDWQSAIHLPKNLEIERCAPLFCAGITAFHAVDSCELKPGQWFAVIGCGGLGQLATRYAKAMGFKVIGLDINDAMLEVAKEAGAGVVYNTMKNKDYVEELKKLTKGGVHAAAVFSNAPQAYASAPTILKFGGLMMIVGVSTKPIEVSTMDMALQKYRIKSESTSIPQRMGKAIEFSGKHSILPKVEFRKLDELQAMIDDMHAGRASTRMAVVF